MQKLPWYELINQKQFEGMIIDSLKEKFIVTTRQACNMYEKVCTEIPIHSDACKIDNCTYSMRKYIINKMATDGDILRQYRGK